MEHISFYCTFIDIKTLSDSITGILKFSGRNCSNVKTKDNF